MTHIVTDTACARCSTKLPALLGVHTCEEQRHAERPLVCSLRPILQGTPGRREHCHVIISFKWLDPVFFFFF